MNRGIQAAGYGPPGGGGYGPPGGGYGPPGGGGYGPPGGGGYGPPGGGGNGLPPDYPGPMGPAQAMPGGPIPGGNPGAAPPKKSKTGLIIGIVVGVLFLGGAVVAAAVLYFFSDVGKGKSVAHEHLPNNCDVVVRGDVEKVKALPSFQTHVKPALDELTNEATKIDDPDAADLKAFLIEARLDPARDIDEVVVCVADPTAKPRYLFILGGQFSTDGIVDAAARRGESSERVTVGGRPAVKSKSKKTAEVVWLGQAEDGAILFSNDETLLASGIQRTDAHTSVYKLDVTKELAFVVTNALMAKQRGELQSNPFTKGLVDISAVTGSLGLAVPGAQVRLATASPTSAVAIEKDLSGLLALAKLGMQKEAKPSKAGEQEALQQARVSVAGNDVVLDFPWTAAGVDQAMKLAGDGIRESQKKKAP